MSYQNELKYIYMILLLLFDFKLIILLIFHEIMEDGATLEYYFNTFICIEEGLSLFTKTHKKKESNENKWNKYANSLVYKPSNIV